MAHNSAPHNLTEVCNAAIHFLEKDGKITLEELMTDIPGPDFPLGGTVINQKDVKAAYATGKSNVSLKIRGDYEIKGKTITFTTIPYRAYRNKIKEQIANNIEELEKVIIDFEDESSVGENKLVFTVKDEGSINTALNKLFAMTDLQTTLSYNMNFIVNGTPQLCNLHTLIKCYVEHQENVLIAATKFDKIKAERRLHILNGLIAAIDQIDRVIELIKASEGKNEARLGLMNMLSIDEIQADAILDMKLGKLTRIDKNELINEKREKEEFIAECNRILNEKNYRNNLLIKQITHLRNTYGDERRTKLLNIEEASKEDKEIEFVEPEKCIVVMTESGLIKRIPTASFKTQKRNGKGVKVQDDITNAVIRTNTIDSLMVFSNKGKMYRLLVNDIPEGTNTSKGQSVKMLVSMEAGEEPAVIYSIYRDTDAKYVLFATKKGLVKKTTLEEYVKTKKKNGIAAINLKDDDELTAVTLIKEEPLVLITQKGMGIKFDSKEIGATSRTSFGVKGITLSDDDSLVAALPIRDEKDKLALFSQNGLAKKFSLDELPIQKRAGKGLMCYKPTDSSGEIAAAALVEDADSVLINGDKTNICIAASDIPNLGRSSLGNIVIKNNKILSVSKV